MKKLDCLGDICPLPVLKLERALPALEEGEPLLLVTDHSCTCSAVGELCAARGLELGTEEVMNGVWELTIRKRVNR